MGWLIGLFVALVLAGLTGELVQTQLFHVTTPIAERGATSDFIIGGIVWLVIGAGIYLLRQRSKANKAAAAQRERDENAARSRHQELTAEQERIATALLSNNRSAVADFNRLPTHLANAHRYLDGAETEYHETAYVPFWTAIENATTELGEFIDCVNRISRASDDYASLARQYNGPVDPFAVSLDATARLHVSEGVSQRIEQVTRPAHRDPEFAKTFLLMRGNAIMVAGFANLGQALGRMTGLLSDSLSQVDRSIQGLSTQMSGVAVGIGSVDAAMRANTAQASSHYRELERQQMQSVRMLDNIQRDRKPFF